MSYEVTWLVEDAIILETIRGRVDQPAMEGIAREIQALVESSSRDSVHVLIDAMQAESMDLNIWSVYTPAKQILKHPRLGWTLVYGHDERLLKSITALLRQISGIRIRGVKDAADALNFLEATDITLSQPAIIEPVLE